MTTSDDENDLVRCLREDAQGYLLKDMEPDELVDCLQAAVDGTTIVAPAMTDALAKVVQSDLLPDVPVRLAVLTERELEIVLYLAEGLSNKAIARELGIVDGTVKLHVRATLKKLGTHSRVEATILALEEGLYRRNTWSNSECPSTSGVISLLYSSLQRGCRKSSNLIWIRNLSRPALQGEEDFFLPPVYGGIGRGYSSSTTGQIDSKWHPLTSVRLKFDRLLRHLSFEPLECGVDVVVVRNEASCLAQTFYRLFGVGRTYW